MWEGEDLLTVYGSNHLDRSFALLYCASDRPGVRYVGLGGIEDCALGLLTSSYPLAVALNGFWRFFAGNLVAIAKDL